MSALPLAAPTAGSWQLRSVPLKFGVSDWTAFSIPLQLHVRSVRLAEKPEPSAEPRPPVLPALGDADGYMLRALPVAGELPAMARIDGYIRYVTLQYQHCFIDLSIGLDAYKSKFSGKTRSTINRKVRKFQELSGGTLNWRSYRTPAEIDEFHALARAVSAKTYQERLLDAGIPDDDAFVGRMRRLAAQDQVRAYILFDGAGKPVSYLYCPVRDGVVIYAYLGYDPDCMKHSVGTVLQWLALEELFAERRFEIFDFTEGQSDHKRLFATHQLRCANILFVRHSPWRRLLLKAHAAADSLSARVGRLAERWGVKARLRKAMRFGLGGSAA